jgi:uncharacterized protein (TIGR02246 family)
MSVDKLLQELHAKEQIRRLTADYAQGLDKRDAAQFEKVWQEDSEWLPSASFGWCHGMEAILAMREKIWANTARTHHFVVNHVIDVDGDTATGTSDLLSEILEHDGSWSRSASTCTDRYVRRDGRWFIAARSAEVEMLGR